MTKSIAGVFVPTHFVREADLASAHLLAQIIYWFSKASNGASHFIVYRFGHRWLAHSREQLMEETGLTPGLVKSALRRLANERIIVIEQHLFRSKNISHIRIHDDCPSWVGEGLPPGLSLSDLLGSAKNANSIEDENHRKNDSDLSAYGATTFSGKKTKIGTEIRSKWGPPLEDTNPITLGLRFSESYAQVYPGEFLAPLTGKQLGQLNLFAKACPEGMAGKVLDWAIRNWNLFTSYAEHEQGAFKSPSLPTTGYLLRYLQTAVSRYKAATEVDKPKSKPKPAYELAFIPTVKLPEPTEPIVTIEEMEKMLWPDD